MRLECMGPNKPYSGVACYCCESSWKQSSSCVFKEKYSIEGFPSLHVQGTGRTSIWRDVNVGHYREEDTNHLLNTFYYISRLNRRDPSGILFTTKISPVCFCFCSFSSVFSLSVATMLALLSLSKTFCKDVILPQMSNA